MRREPKLGGMDVLRMACVRTPDLESALLARPEGSEDGTYVERILRETGGGSQRVKWGFEEPANANQLADRMEAGEGVWARSGWDLVIVSGYVDVADERSLDIPAYCAALGRAIRDAKERHDAHVIAFNVATGDPGRHQHSFAQSEIEPFLVRAHKVNLALIKLSYLHGISIIDVDRVVAELGAAEHVLGRLSYSEPANRAIGEEFVRVLADIGFFESRPMLMQVGNPEAE